MCGTQTGDALANIVNRLQASPDRYAGEILSNDPDPLGHLSLIVERLHLQVRAAATDCGLNHALLAIGVFESLTVLGLCCTKSSLHLASFVVKGASEPIQAQPASKIPQILRRKNRKEKNENVPAESASHKTGLTAGPPTAGVAVIATTISERSRRAKTAQYPLLTLR